MLTEAETAALFLSMKVAIAATVVALPLAVWVAFLLARRQFVGKLFVDALVHAPLILPPVVVGYLLLELLGPRQPVGAWLKEWLGLEFAFDWKGGALAAGIMAFPLMVRAVRLSVEGIDRRLEAAARTLGANRRRVFFTISLPLVVPGILGGALLGFARALGEFGATITFVANIPGVTRTLPLALFTAVQSPGGETAALRFLVMSLVLAFAALFLSEFLARRARRGLGAK